MPKGISKKGYRVYRKGPKAGLPMGTGNKPVHFVARYPENEVSTILFPKPIVEKVEVKETDFQIEQRLSERFDVLEAMAKLTLSGDTPSIIVSGPPGLGKSHTIDTLLKEHDPEGKRHSYIKGYVRATGLFKTAYQNRHKGNVIIFDDADAIFSDETSLNLLKAICDSSEERTVSYLSEYSLTDEVDGGEIPKTFTFEASVIFLTNYDFDAMIEKGAKLAPHMQALMSRSHYIDLTLKSKRDYIVRIKQVIKNGMLRAHGLNHLQEVEVMSFIEENFDKLREVSLRSAIKIAALRKTKPDTWKKIAKITCCKG